MMTKDSTSDATSIRAIAAAIILVTLGFIYRKTFLSSVLIGGLFFGVDVHYCKVNI